MYHNLSLFLKSQRNLWLKIPVLTITLLFVLRLSRIEDILFVFLLPSIFLVQEVQSTLYNDYQIGFIECWIGNGSTMAYYMTFRIISFALCLVLPFVLSCVFFIPLELFFSLFFVSLNCVCLGCLLGNSSLPNPYLGIFILPLQIPSLIWILQALNTEAYLSATFLCAGIMVISMSLNFLLCDSLQKGNF